MQRFHPLLFRGRVARYCGASALAPSRSLSVESEKNEQVAKFNPQAGKPRSLDAARKSIQVAATQASKVIGSARKTLEMAAKRSEEATDASSRTAAIAREVVAGSATKVADRAMNGAKIAHDCVTRSATKFGVQAAESAKRELRRWFFKIGMFAAGLVFVYGFAKGIPLALVAYSQNRLGPSPLTQSTTESST
jgi:hypothetical protein